MKFSSYVLCVTIHKAYILHKYTSKHTHTITSSQHSLAVCTSNLLGMKTAVTNKQLNALRGPSQLGHARSDLLVQTANSLLEQSPFLWLEAGDDAIVVSDDEHDVLPQHPQLLTLLVDLSSIVRHLKPQPLPVVHLTKQLEQRPTEAHLY